MDVGSANSKSVRNVIFDAYRESERDAVGLVQHYVKAALWPWSPGGATVSIGPDITSRFDDYLIIIETDLLPHYPFQFKYRPERNDGDMDMAHRVGKDAFKFFRYRPALPVDDHIMLGEE